MYYKLTAEQRDGLMKILMEIPAKLSINAILLLNNLELIKDVHTEEKPQAD